MRLHRPGYRLKEAEAWRDSTHPTRCGHLWGGGATAHVGGGSLRGNGHISFPMFWHHCGALLHVGIDGILR